MNKGYTCRKVYTFDKMQGQNNIIRYVRYTVSLSFAITLHLRSPYLLLWLWNIILERQVNVLGLYLYIVFDNLHSSEPGTV